MQIRKNLNSNILPGCKFMMGLNLGHSKCKIHQAHYSANLVVIWSMYSIYTTISD